jgi:hypothetical protein
MALPKNYSFGNIECEIVRRVTPTSYGAFELEYVCYDRLLNEPYDEIDVVLDLTSDNIKKLSKSIEDAFMRTRA